MKSSAFASLCLLILAAGCGPGGQPPEVVRPIAEWVIDKGGSLEIEGSSLKVTAKGRIPQGPFRILTINLNERPVTDQDLERLQPLEGLLALQLHSTRVTDQGLDAIASLTSLKTLELTNTRVTDKGLEKLAGLKNLERLYVHNTPVTDDGIEALRSRLSGCRILH
ncbi:MAG TPA: hypothetical protein VML55_00835 [Planctomycetaceae bacterium]|nr:hypothetical protein [Planctomycetaceae bacterium]